MKFYKTIMSSHCDHGHTYVIANATTHRKREVWLTPRVVLQGLVNILKTEDEWEMNLGWNCG